MQKSISYSAKTALSTNFQKGYQDTSTSYKDTYSSKLALNASFTKPNFQKNKIKFFFENSPKKPPRVKNLSLLSNSGIKNTLQQYDRLKQSKIPILRIKSAIISENISVKPNLGNLIMNSSHKYIKANIQSVSGAYQFPDSIGNETIVEHNMELKIKDLKNQMKILGLQSSLSSEEDQS